MNAVLTRFYSYAMPDNSEESIYREMFIMNVTIAKGSMHLKQLQSSDMARRVILSNHRAGSSVILRLVLVMAECYFPVIWPFILYLHLFVLLIGWFCCHYVSIWLPTQLVHSSEEFTAVLHSNTLLHCHTHLFQQCRVTCELLSLRQPITVQLQTQRVYV